MNGQATLSLTALALGDHDLTASYDGDAEFIGSSTTGPSASWWTIPHRLSRCRSHPLSWSLSVALGENRPTAEIKQENPCYIHPEERSLRSEGWAAMSVAIVTGASRGLGEALAKGLARAGWSLVVDGRDRTTWTPPQSGIRAQAAPGAHVVAIVGDITDPDHRHDLTAATFELGGLDLVVNNAGTLGTSPLPSLADYPLGDLRVAFEVNIVAPSACSRMRCRCSSTRRGPRIVNVTSDAAVEAYEGWGGYGAGKAALEHLGAVLAAEFPALKVWSVDPAICAPPCTRPRSRARTSPTGPSRPAPCRVRGAHRERPPERPLPRRRTRLDGSGGMSAVTAPPLDHGAANRLPELHPLSFSLPPELEAPSPPEYRGMTRDAVRMLVATRSDGALVHSTFSELPRFLDEGDLVVINTSAPWPPRSTARRPTARPSRSTSRPNCPPASGP